MSDGTGGSGSFPPPPGGGSDYPGGRGRQGWGDSGRQGQGQQDWGGGQQDWGGGQQGWGGGQQGWGDAPPARNNPALASMICGLVSLGCLFLFFFLITVPIAVVTALAALITGVFGLRAAGRLGTGRGQAITGLVTGTITLLIVGLFTFAAFAAWSQFGFDANPFTEPEAFMEEMEERGIEVDEDGQVDVEELERQLQEEQGNQF